MVAITALARDVFERNYWKHRNAYDKGDFHGEGFWRAFAHSAGISLTDSQIAELIRHDVTTWTETDPIMIDWLRRLHAAGFLLAMLSNMVKEIHQHMDQHFEWLAVFQHTTWSYELGISKPAAAIYSHTLQKLGVNAYEALFIDDLAENVRGAEAVGLNAILFTTPSQLQLDLDSRGYGAKMPPVISAR
jgi:putative hydrolase of the HAD superfamily